MIARRSFLLCGACILIAPSAKAQVPSTNIADLISFLTGHKVQAERHASLLKRLLAKKTDKLTEAELLYIAGETAVSKLISELVTDLTTDNDLSLKISRYRQLATDVNEKSLRFTEFSTSSIKVERADAEGRLKDLQFALTKARPRSMTYNRVTEALGQQNEYLSMITAYDLLSNEVKASALKSSGVTTLDPSADNWFAYGVKPHYTPTGGNVVRLDILHPVVESVLSVWREWRSISTERRQAIVKALTDQRWRPFPEA